MRAVPGHVASLLTAPLLLAGCLAPVPAAEPPNTAVLSQSAPPEPGVYFIRVSGDGDFAEYYPLAAPVDTTDSWREVRNSDAFTADGWYELTPRGAWLPRPDLSNLTLDDALQTVNPLRPAR